MSIKYTGACSTHVKFNDECKMRVLFRTNRQIIATKVFSSYLCFAYIIHLAQQQCLRVFNQATSKLQISIEKLVKRKTMVLVKSGIVHCGAILRTLRCEREVCNA